MRTNCLHFAHFSAKTPLKKFGKFFKVVVNQEGSISHQFVKHKHSSYAHGTDASQNCRFAVKIFDVFWFASANNFSAKNVRTPETSSPTVSTSEVKAGGNGKNTPLEC